MAFFKALIPGFLLTFVVCLVMGSNGATGAWLNIHRAAIEGWEYYWSWPLFFASTGLAWSLFWMME